MKKFILGCFGDDFTGSSDAASFIKKGGLNTIMLTRLPGDDFIIPEEIDAVVVALKTRTIPADEAVELSKEVYEWFDEENFEHIYYKYCSTFDSTPHGNIGPVTDMLLEASKQKFTILSPALPINLRTVEKGILYVNGVRLEDSHMRIHPLTPMTDSSLKKLMEAQGKYEAFNLYKEDLAKSSSDIHEIIRHLEIENEHFYLIPDFTDDKDGEKIADLFKDLKVLTGGSGLLEYLGRSYSTNKVKNVHRRSLKTGGKGILLAGSCSKVTLEQIETYKEHQKQTEALDVSRIMENRMAYLGIIKEMLDNQEGDILFYSSQDSEKVSELQEEFGVEILSEAIEVFTAEIAQYAYESGYRRFIIAGGETSGAVTKKLGFEAFHILEDIEPGLPVMVPVYDEEVRIVLKSGSFGKSEFFSQAMKQITNIEVEHGDK